MTMQRRQSSNIRCLISLLLLGDFLFLNVSSVNVPRKIIIRNHSGRRVEVNWIHPNTGDRALMSQPDILTGAEFNMDSYVSHSFEIKELSSVTRFGGGKCRHSSCQTARFTVNENHQQVIFVQEDFTIMHEDHTTVARSQAKRLLENCTNLARDSIQKNATTALLQETVDCFSDQVTQAFLERSEALAFEEKVRTQYLSKAFENYTCLDPHLATTKALEHTTWRDGQNHYRVQILLNRPASKVHLVEQFITPQECLAIQEAAEPRLNKAEVADGVGGSLLSQNRRAWQAGIAIPPSGPIAQVTRRIYQYLNHVLPGLQIDQEGQEELMSIQYYGRPNSTQPPDQYVPHCDGDCEGYPHKNGTRVATMVMYCTVPSRGSGATNFRNAGIHIVPTKGNAVFFSYMDPETRLMDKGWTEHSGCPVYRGEKIIVTHWIRLGVTKEVPWTRYDSLGRLKEPLEKLEDDGNNQWLARAIEQMNKMQELKKERDELRAAAAVAEEES